MTPTPILEVVRLGFPWQTIDPFLFCVHHNDAYPKGNEAFGPAASLAGRDLGNDFAGIDGWRMYHGQTVPGFPQHPHRGFETVTIVRAGLIDHSDSLGAAARFGQGDVQWLTAGKGVVHSEMFPLLNRDKPNPAELFQIWLNLAPHDKMAEPHFKMLWAPQIPIHIDTDAQGREVKVTTVAGSYGKSHPPSPPPHSWAANPENDVAISTIALSPHARFTLPAVLPRAGKSTPVNRMLYFFQGTNAEIAGERLTAGVGIRLQAEATVDLVSGDAPAEFLLLQGRPIGAPVANYGPFVMNTRAELRQAFLDYESTRFGGWPWHRDDPVHAADEGRFARYPDGRIDRPPV